MQYPCRHCFSLQSMEWKLFSIGIQCLLGGEGDSGQPMFRRALHNGPLEKCFEHGTINCCQRLYLQATLDVVGDKPGLIHSLRGRINF